jgi:hypothetical protein
MKKYLLIISILLTINFTVPNNNLLFQRSITNIEYSQDIKIRYSDKNEEIKQKIVLYLKKNILYKQVLRVQVSEYYNTS